MGRRPTPATLGSLLAIAAGVVIALIVLAAASLLPPAPGTRLRVAADPAGKVLFVDRFAGPDGLITNHFATWNDGPSAARSRTWRAESGSLLRRSGAAWTGVPSDQAPNAQSSNGTGSQLFRVWTIRPDFGDVRIDMQLRNEGYVAGTRRYPRESWDGVKIWPRRQPGRGSVALYTAEVNRRQGNVMIQKKCARTDGYVILAQTDDRRRARLRRWEHVGATVRTNADGSVTLGVIRHGAVVLRATDRGAGGCQPIRRPGAVGVRGDNTQFSFDDFTVRSLGR